MRKFTILAIIIAFVGCSQYSEKLDIIISIPTNNPNEFYASMPECDTRTYVEDNKYLRWNADDEITVFAGNSYNSHWQFAGENGANSGKFNELEDSGFVTGTPLDLTANYAIYPYDENITISEAGAVSLTLPAVQEYNHAYENSFGVGANTMMAVTKNTSDNFLSFKNLCGYLKLKFYGNDVTVKSITVKGNNGEKIAGPATVSMAYGSEPTITMGDDATDTITIDCGEGVALSNDSANPITFWVVIPEITFEGGITIEVTDINDQTFSKQTTNAVPIENNLIQPMAVLEVEAAPAGPANNEIWYTSSNGNVVTPYATDAFNANIVSNTYDAEKECWVIKFDGDVTTIGEWAFYECSSLTSVTIPDSVITIGDYAFAHCSSLTSVTIPDSVTSIGNSAFEYCESLASTTIGKGVTSIGQSAFTDVTGELIVKCNIPDSTFRWAKFTSVTIGEGATTIGQSAFSECGNMTSLTISDSVTTIERGAFYRCSSLTSVTIPDSVTSIDTYAFGECFKLTDLTMGNGVTTVGEDAFSGVQNVYITDLSTWCKIDFMNTSSNPMNFTANLYLNNELVTELVIPSDITEIKAYAFRGCNSLTSVTIPEGVTSIGDSAFEYCKSLTSVYCKPTTPPTGTGNMFSNNASGRKIYVPAESVDAYKSAPYWSWSTYKSNIVGYDF